MSFKDFTTNFGRLEICFLGPDSLGDQEDESEKRKWEGCLFEGMWRRRVNAGGCSNYPGMKFALHSNVQLFHNFRTYVSLSHEF